MPLKNIDYKAPEEIFNYCAMFNIILFVIMMLKEHKICDFDICFILYTYFSIKSAGKHLTLLTLFLGDMFAGDGYFTSYFLFVMSHRYLFPSFILNPKVEFVDRRHEARVSLCGNRKECT